MSCRNCETTRPAYRDGLCTQCYTFGKRATHCVKCKKPLSPDNPDNYCTTCYPYDQACDRYHDMKLYDPMEKMLEQPGMRNEVNEEMGRAMGGKPNLL